MPSFVAKKPAVLSWDAFPEAPPEAESWRPDPGSIPKPGALIDPRFHKDPHADEKKAAMKREMRLNGSAGSSSSSAGIAPQVRAPIGGWPAQQSRANSSMYAREFALPGDFDASPAGPAMTTTKGTMETMPIMMPSTYRPSTPATTVKSTKSVASAKSVVPLWAGPLEKALAEDTSNMQSIPATVASSSVPPHLRIRKTAGSAKGAQPLTDQGRSLNVSAASYKPASLESLESHYEAAREASRRVSDTTISETIVNDEASHKDEALARKMATTDLGLHDTKHGLKPQEEMNGHGPKQSGPMSTSTSTAMPTPNANTNGNTNGSTNGSTKDNTIATGASHNHYLKTSLILQMERDIQEDKLMALSEAQLDQLLVKVSTLHVQWYTGKHSDNDIEQGEAVSQASQQGDVSSGKVKGVSTKTASSRNTAYL